MHLPSKLSAYARLMRWDKPIGIYLCLWPSLWALLIANHGYPSLSLFLIIIAGSIVVRSAGCVINDIWDRNVDKHVERTKQRPLTSGELSLSEALILFTTLGVIAFVLVSYLGTLSIEIAVAAGLLTTLYPLAKRITYFPQVVLGITFNTGVLIAFAATQNTLPPIAWILYVTTIVWTVAYDTLYAMADKKDDLAIGIKSTAIKFAEHDKKIVACLQGIVLLGLLATAYLAHLNVIFLLFLLPVITLFTYQHQLMQTPEGAFKAFLNNHWVGFTILLAFILQYC